MEKNFLFWFIVVPMIAIGAIGTILAFFSFIFYHEEGEKEVTLKDAIVRAVLFILFWIFVIILIL